MFSLESIKLMCGMGWGDEVPCTLLPTILLGILKKEFQQLWKGSTGKVLKVSPSRSANNDPSVVEMEAMGEGNSSHSPDLEQNVDPLRHPHPHPHPHPLSSLHVPKDEEVEIELSPFEKEERMSPPRKPDAIGGDLNPFSEAL